MWTSQCFGIRSYNYHRKIQYIHVNSQMKNADMARQSENKIVQFTIEGCSHGWSECDALGGSAQSRLPRSSALWASQVFFFVLLSLWFWFLLLSCRCLSEPVRHSWLCCAGRTAAQHSQDCLTVLLSASWKSLFSSACFHPVSQLQDSLGCAVLYTMQPCTAKPFLKFFSLVLSG